MNRQIELEIAGQRLKIRTDEDEEYMRSLARYVSEQLDGLGGAQRGTTTLSLVLLTALRMADDFHKLKASHESLNESVEALAVRVEEALAQEPQ